MSYYSKDLTQEPCKCAFQSDAQWFVMNPTRTKVLRIPWECERAKELDPDEGISQLVLVYIAASIDAVREAGQDALLQICRKSFLFVGRADGRNLDTDAAVDGFIALIDDKDHGHQLPRVSIN